MTVLMRKGDKFADIFDSPETIAQAQKDGYHVCTNEEANARELLKANTSNEETDNEPKKRGRKKAEKSDDLESTETTGNEETGN